MSVIKEISVFNGSTWESSSIGANASNITLSNNIAGNTNLETALSNILPASQLSANAVVVTDGNKRLTAASNVSTTQLEYLSGVTSDIQTQLNNKVNIFSLNNMTKQVQMGTDTDHDQFLTINTKDGNNKREGIRISQAGTFQIYDLDRSREVFSFNCLSRNSVVDRQYYFLSAAHLTSNGKILTFMIPALCSGGIGNRNNSINLDIVDLRFSARHVGGGYAYLKGTQTSSTSSASTYYPLNSVENSIIMQNNKETVHNSLGASSTVTSPIAIYGHNPSGLGVIINLRQQLCSSTAGALVTNNTPLVVEGSITIHTSFKS